MGNLDSELIIAAKKGSSLKVIKSLVKETTTVEELKIAVMNATFVHLKRSMLGDDKSYNKVLNFLSEEVVKRQS